ncbi:MAG: rhodanese-like domain-containing protein [Candidatus Dormibacteraceae bacterium]
MATTSLPPFPPTSALSELLDQPRDLRAGELGELTRRVVDTPALWRPLIRHDPQRRWYERLLLTPRVEVWLIGWAPWQGTRPHDHGGTEGAMTVAEGVLTEHVYLGLAPEDREVHPQKTLERGAGSVATFAIDHVHRVVNRSTVNATSVHAYSPAGQPMRFYGADAQRQTTEGGVLTVDDLLARARRRLTRLTPEEAARAAAEGALLVDIRPEAQRLREGAIPGALPIERNLLEWRLDPQSPWHLPQMRDHDQRVVVLCSEGYTSSLAAASLQDLGLTCVTDLEGGFRAWAAAGLPTVNV